MCRYLDIKGLAVLSCASLTLRCGQRRRRRDAAGGGCIGAVRSAHALAPPEPRALRCVAYRGARREGLTAPPLTNLVGVEDCALRSSIKHGPATPSLRAHLPQCLSLAPRGDASATSLPSQLPRGSLRRLPRCWPRNSPNSQPDSRTPRPPGGRTSQPAHVYVWDGAKREGPTHCTTCHHSSTVHATSTASTAAPP